MPAEDRDRLFERALARHLRGRGGDDSACPDAETLAAYHEGSLSAEEISAAGKHFAGCARCQEILTQLEATQHISESRSQGDHLAAAGAVARAKNSEVSQETSAPAAAARSPKGTESKVTHFPGRKKWLLRWAAPAGAIAAGLLLYLSFRDLRSPAKHAEPATEIAENREDSARAREAYVPPAAAQGPPREVPQTPPAVTPKQDEDHLAAGASRQQPAQPAPKVLLDELERLHSEAEPKDSKQEKKPVPPPPVSGSAIEGNANAGQSGGRNSALEFAKNPAKTRSDAADKSVVAGSLQNERDAQQQSAQAQTGAVANGAPATPASAPPPAPVPSVSQQVTVMAEAPEVNASSSQVAALNKKKADLPVMSRNVIDLALLPPRMVVASNGKSIWRFGEHGTIAHSSDDGKTWKSQEMPVTANLTGGSAPAKNICWIAGAAGTLLRTTDGGKHWQLILTPIAGDVGGVLASDGNHATIWDVPRQTTYQTSNGGKTWDRKIAE